MTPTSSRYFYPRPPRGGRRTAQMIDPELVQFLSTPSARRATSSTILESPRRSFLSTPSARRATWQVDGTTGRLENFYPRPPRGGRRRTIVSPSSRSTYFYPRPPRGGRPFVSLVDKAANKFLSTPSARRATRKLHPEPGRRGISIHALREEGDLCSIIDQPDEEKISIHALREEGDPDSRH